MNAAKDRKSFKVHRGSRTHLELIKKIEYAQKKGWSPTWLYDGQIMFIVDLIDVGDNNYVVCLEE